MTVVTTHDKQVPFDSALEKATITHVEGVDDKHMVEDQLAVGERSEKVGGVLHKTCVPGVFSSGRCSLRPRSY